MRGLALRKGEKEGAAAEITPMQMLQVAVEQNADLEKLEKLMGLVDRHKAALAKQAFDVAMAAFKKEPPTLVKDTHVKYENRGGGETDYYHESLDQVSTVIGVALAEHGLHHSWETKQEQGGLITVTCILGHELGHSRTVSLSALPDTSGGKNPVQGVGSTVTYLERYTLKAIVGLAAAGQDDADDAPPGGKPVPSERPKREDYTDGPPPETDHGEPFELTDEFGNIAGVCETPEGWLDAASKYLGKDLSNAAGAAKVFQEHNQEILNRIHDTLGSARDNPRLASFYTLLNGKRGD